VFVCSIIWKQFSYIYTELDLQPTITTKLCNVLWFCCNSVPKFSLKFSFLLRCFINMALDVVTLNCGVCYRDLNHIMWKPLFHLPCCSPCECEPQWPSPARQAARLHLRVVRLPPTTHRRRADAQQPADLDWENGTMVAKLWNHFYYLFDI